MGTVVSTVDMKRVVDGNIQSYIEQATAKYSRLLNKSPTFATYYAQDLVESGADINLGGVIEIVGPESPLRFAAVHDFPLYGITEADVSVSYDDVQGLTSGNVGGEVLVLPGTLEPKENDMFVLQRDGRNLVFRVKQADPDRLEGRAFFKVQYFLDEIDPAALEAQVVSEFAFEMDNLGTAATPIVEADIALLLRELDEVVARLTESYWRAFYDRSSGTLLLRDGPGDRAVHDRAVEIFCARHALFSAPGYLRGRHVHVVDYADRGLYEDIVYPTTLHGMAEAQAASWAGGFVQCKLATVHPTSPSSPFFADFASEGYDEVTPFPGGDLPIGGVGFRESLMAGNTSGLSKMQQIAAQCLTGQYGGGDRRSKMRQLVDDLNDAGVRVDRKAFFWLAPIAFLQAKRLRSQEHQQ